MRQPPWDQNAIFGTEADAHPDRYLVHYTTVGSAAAIALTGAIALSPLTPMNDPRESQSRQIMTMFTGGSVPDDERSRFEQELWRLRGRVRLACFTVDQPRDAIEKLPRHNDRDAQFEDRRGYAHSRMWTQYAAWQSGVCLVFERTKLLTTAQRTFEARCHDGPVKYVPGFDEALHRAELVNFDDPDSALHHRRNVIPSLFVKNNDWAAENEFRVLVDDWYSGPCLLPISESLVGVALGVSFMPHQLPVIEALAEKFHLRNEVAHMVLNAGVLQAWPARRRTGALRLWTDGETRSVAAVLDH